ncbi:hypothetical protein PLICRDRAFT_36272 [Plicaturopsis crispa FD-325 SS-3]|nr:hypothetical protein PLICRDRAFT_36272 [Plicaturopsis crispa FD-325 SS-3]
MSSQGDENEQQSLTGLLLPGEDIDMDDDDDEYIDEEEEEEEDADYEGDLVDALEHASSRGISLVDLGRHFGITIRTTQPLADDNDDDDEEYFSGYGRRRRTALGSWYPKITEPQKAGVELLMSGQFGRVGHKIRRSQNDNSVFRTLRRQETHGTGNREDLINGLVPNCDGTAVASYSSNVYSGQYSTDAQFYYTCGQDFRLHIYNPAEQASSAPPYSRVHTTRYGHATTMKLNKTIQGHPGRWTITDSHVSPDNERIIYASMGPTVYMTSTREGDVTQVPIKFSDPPRRGWDVDWDSSFSVWCCKFSADGNEVVAGGGGRIFVYDLEADRRTVNILAHTDDVNSCCWADTASGNVLISASDDSFLKVWDRRSLGSSPRPSGVLIGHTEGITNVSAKGDGRYVISNGKDQTLRLWDLRNMHSSAEFDRVAGEFYGVPSYDYRYGYYPKPKHQAHPKDCSVMMYSGHTVLQTLIRCNFSPTETTGGQYIYSGSADGKIHIWSVDGRVVQVLDRTNALPISFDPSAPELEATRGHRHNVCVRDVSWHPHEPVLMSTGWESGRGGSIVARHEWKGLSKTAGGLEDWTEKHRQEESERGRRQPQREGGRRIPGSFDEEDEDL